MRTYARLDALKKWTFDTVCKGRRMKQEPPERDITKYKEPVEPQVYIAYTPKRLDETGDLEVQLRSMAPCIVIMPTASYVEYMMPKRFDQYNGIHRPREYGQQLNVQVLFAVYEDDLRLPGFVDKYEQTREFDLTLLREGTQEGLQTLLDWMDEYREALLVQECIPGCDLILDRENFVYGMRSDQKYISDNRPLYYGLCDIGFNCVSETAVNPEVAAILD